MIAEYPYILQIRDEVIYESLDRIKAETSRRSALFTRNNKGASLKGVFGKFKISDELSAFLPLLSYLGIIYKKNEIVSDVLKWFEVPMDFLNYGKPYQKLSTAVEKSEKIKSLVLNMTRGMDLNKG